MTDWDDIRRTLDYIEKLPKWDLFSKNNDPSKDYWRQDIFRLPSVANSLSTSYTEAFKMQREGSCGTAACLAGWKTILDGMDDTTDEYQYARKAWGLHSGHASLLFAGANTIPQMRQLVDYFEEQEK